MRHSALLFISLLAIALSSCSSPRTTTQFYHTHKVKEGVINFKIPGIVTWMGSGIARKAVKDPSAKAALKLAQKARRMRIMVAEDVSIISNSEIYSFISNIKKNGYEDLIQVRDGSTLVTIMARDKNERLRNLLILVNEEDNFVYFDLKSRMKYEDLSDMINYFINMEKDDDDIDIDEQPPAQEKKKAKTPRA